MLEPCGLDVAWTKEQPGWPRLLPGDVNSLDQLMSTGFTCKWLIKGLGLLWLNVSGGGMLVCCVSTPLPGALGHFQAVFSAGQLLGV